jgi:hypothetical protein
LRAEVLAPLYDPTRRYPGLFRTFADLIERPSEHPTPQMARTVLAFANTYGRLGIAEPLPPEVGDGEMGESLWDWWHAIDELQGTLVVSDALKEGTIDALASYVTVHTQRQDATPGQPTRYRVPTAQEAIRLQHELEKQGTLWYCDAHVAHGSTTYHPESSSEDVAQAIRKAAWRGVINQINWKIASNPDEPAYARVEMTFLPEREPHPRFRLRARHLLGALWMQLARYVNGNTAYVSCRTCGTWLELSLADTGYRTHRAYCSDACRSKAYRDRQVRAHQLMQEGRPLASIADELETDVQTLQGWLAKPPPGQGTRRRGRPPKHAVLR